MTLTKGIVYTSSLCTSPFLAYITQHCINIMEILSWWLSMWPYNFWMHCSTKILVYLLLNNCHDNYIFQAYYTVESWCLTFWTTWENRNWFEKLWGLKIVCKFLLNVFWPREQEIAFNNQEGRKVKSLKNRDSTVVMSDFSIRWVLKFDTDIQMYLLWNNNITNNQ